MSHAILLISCPDQIGITAAVTNFIYKNKGNIVHADQHIDEQSNTFFMRIEWDLNNFAVTKNQVGKNFQPLAHKFDMDWDLHFSDLKQRIAVFVSRHVHCLYDILLRHRKGELTCEIPVIFSNHEDAKHIADEFHIKFNHFSMTSGTKKLQEEKEIALLKKEKIDLVVLARYHQILTEGFVKTFPRQIINIHHSFLPAFPGKNPYRRAFQKGVKIIGATSHFVTVDLDEGPIIEQDTVRVSHRDTLEDMVRKGEDLEKAVLLRALRWALERKILCYGNKTVVFN